MAKKQYRRGSADDHVTKRLTKSAQGFKLADLQEVKPTSFSDLKKHWDKQKSGNVGVYYNLPATEEFFNFDEKFCMTRKVTDESIQQMATAISRDGQIHPIRARFKNNKLQIVSGWTRALACKLLGIPVATILTDDSEALSYEKAVAENAARNEFLDIDKINNFKRLYDAGKKIEEIGSIFNLSVSMIRQAINVVDFVDLVQAVEKKDITLAHARSLVKVIKDNNFDRSQYGVIIQQIKEQGISRDNIDFLVQELVLTNFKPVVKVPTTTPTPAPLSEKTATNTQTNVPPNENQPLADAKEKKPKLQTDYFLEIPGKKFVMAAKGNPFKTPLDDLEKMKSSALRFVEYLEKRISEKTSGINS